MSASHIFFLVSRVAAFLVHYLISPRVVETTGQLLALNVPCAVIILFLRMIRTDTGLILLSPILLVVTAVQSGDVLLGHVLQRRSASIL